jgi:hypothetical protein
MPGQSKQETSGPIKNRLKEFPNQSLCEHAGKLYCKACHTCITNSADAIKQHLNTKNHQLNLDKLAKRSEEDVAQGDTITAYCMQHPAENRALRGLLLQSHATLRHASESSRS